MDHLKTDEERRNRWYAKDVEPRFVEVHTISLALIKKRLEQHHPSEEVLTGSGSYSDDVKVPGIPASLLGCTEGRNFLKSQLCRDGFVVVKEALHISQCNHAISLAWDYLEGASAAEKNIQLNDLYSSRPTKVDADEKNSKPENAFRNLDAPTVSRHDPTTHNSPYYPRTVEGGICPFYGSGHTKLQWYLRSQSAVQDIFATIHNVKREELITSLDGLILWTEGGMKRKNKIGDDNIGGDRGWFHIDQNPQMKPDFASVQGLVNLLPVTKDTGGNVLQIGSHKFFPEHYLEDVEQTSSSSSSESQLLFYKERLKEIQGDDWLEIDPNDSKLLQKEKTIACLLGPGDVLIWDSRLVHCSHPPTFSSNDQVDNLFEKYGLHKHGLLRAAGLVNMIPRDQCSVHAHKDRMQAIQDARTLTHWVNKGSPLAEERCEEVAKEEQCINFMKKVGSGVLLSYDDLNLEQKKLV